MPKKEPKQAKLVPQKHGGAIRVGGKVGNKGGIGRPPTWFHETARKLVYEKQLLQRLARIATAQVGEIKHVMDAKTGVVVQEFCETPLREQIKAIELLARVGKVLEKEQLAEGGTSINVVVRSLQLDIQPRTH
jgi:hypothetical protein